MAKEEGVVRLDIKKAGGLLSQCIEDVNEWTDGTEVSVAARRAINGLVDITSNGDLNDPLAHTLANAVLMSSMQLVVHMLEKGMGQLKTNDEMRGLFHKEQKDVVLGVTYPMVRRAVQNAYEQNKADRVFFVDDHVDYEEAVDAHLERITSQLVSLAGALTAVMLRVKGISEVQTLVGAGQPREGAQRYLDLVGVVRLLCCGDATSIQEVFGFTSPSNYMAVVMPAMTHDHYGYRRNYMKFLQANMANTDNVENHMPLPSLGMLAAMQSMTKQDQEIDQTDSIDIESHARGKASNTEQDKSDDLEALGEVPFKLSYFDDIRKFNASMDPSAQVVNNLMLAMFDDEASEEEKKFLYIPSSALAMHLCLNQDIEGSVEDMVGNGQFMPAEWAPHAVPRLVGIAKAGRMLVQIDPSLKEHVDKNGKMPPTMVVPLIQRLMGGAWRLIFEPVAIKQPGGMQMGLKGVSWE